MILNGHGDCVNYISFPRKINIKRYWNGDKFVDALEYCQVCTNTSTNNECQYLTQETSCIGPASFRCQCQPGKYFNKDRYKSESLLEFNESCSQKDSCTEKPLRCNCLLFQFIDPIISQCQNQFNTNAASFASLTKLITTIATSQSTMCSNNVTQG